MCADAVARIASGGVTHIMSSWIWKMQLINLNYENNAKGHSPEDFPPPPFFFFSSLPLHLFFFFLNPFLLFCQNTTPLPGDVCTAWRFPGKVTLPKTFVVIWKPLPTPAVARGTGTAVSRVCHAGRHSAGLVPQSSLRPLTFQSKLQSSSLSFMEVEKLFRR